MSDAFNNKKQYLKWLNGELSDDEIEVLKKSDDFNVVEKLLPKQDLGLYPSLKKTIEI